MNRRSKIAGAIAVSAVVVGGGIAGALWSANGNGPGQAQALSAVTLTVEAATGAADLYPGFTDGDLFFTVENNNPYPVELTAMTAGAVTSLNHPACDSSKVTVANAPISVAVPAGGISGTLTIPDVVTMLADAPDACQGVVFEIELTLTGSQT